MTTRKLDIREEPGTGHPFCVHVDGRVHGWLASQDDAEALARIFREAGRDATIGGIDMREKLTPHGTAKARADQRKARQDTPPDSQPRAVTIVCVPGRPCEIVSAPAGRELEAG
jgi:hypothetical protein